MFSMDSVFGSNSFFGTGFSLGCDNSTCIYNDGFQCTSSIGCMFYPSDFLNSNTDKVFNDSTDGNFDNFIK